VYYYNIIRSSVILKNLKILKSNKLLQTIQTFQSVNLLQFTMFTYNTSMAQCCTEFNWQTMLDMAVFNISYRTFNTRNIYIINNTWYCLEYYVRLIEFIRNSVVFCLGWYHYLRKTTKGNAFWPNLFDFKLKYNVGLTTIDHINNLHAVLWLSSFTRCSKSTNHTRRRSIARSLWRS